MTELEYNEELSRIDRDYEKSKYDLMTKYAASKRIYDIGDIVMGFNTIIKIEKYGTYIGLGMPCPIYIGLELNKNLSPKKRQQVTRIYGNENTEKLN